MVKSLDHLTKGSFPQHFDDFISEGNMITQNLKHKSCFKIYSSINDGNISMVGKSLVFELIVPQENERNDFF